MGNKNRTVFKLYFLKNTKLGDRDVGVNLEGVREGVGLGSAYDQNTFNKILKV